MSAIASNWPPIRKDAPISTSKPRVHRPEAENAATDAIAPAMPATISAPLTCGANSIQISQMGRCTCRDASSARTGSPMLITTKRAVRTIEIHDASSTRGHGPTEIDSAVVVRMLPR